MMMGEALQQATAPGLDVQDLLVSMGVQFVGITAAVYALAEYTAGWIPFGKSGRDSPRWYEARKRIAAVAWSMVLSTFAYGWGMVKLPDAVSTDVVPFADHWAFRLAGVMVLGLISVAMAHGAHAVVGKKKTGVLPK